MTIYIRKWMYLTIIHSFMAFIFVSTEISTLKAGGENVRK